MNRFEGIPHGWEFVGILPGQGMNESVYRTPDHGYVTANGWAVPTHIGERLAAQHAHSTTRRPARRVQE